MSLNPRRHHRTRSASHPATESGQATAEYGLVMLAAAAMAGLLLAWATSSGGITRLMNAVMNAIVGDIGGP